jgi:hypothetical protein
MAMRYPRPPRAFARDRGACGGWGPPPGATRDDDPRPGGVLLPVDNQGRPVHPLHHGSPFGEVQLVGWQLRGDIGVDPAEVRALLKAEASRRRKARMAI